MLNFQYSLLKNRNCLFIRVCVCIRGVIHIPLRCPDNVNGIAADPQPDWSFDNLLSELHSIEKKLAEASDDRAPSFTKIQPRYV